MGQLVNYLLMRTPAARMGDEDKKGAEPGKIPTSRIVISIIGLLIGIVASFFITGLEAYSTAQQVSVTPQTVSPAGTQVGGASAKLSTPQEPQVNPFTWHRLWTSSLIALVVCGLTYQALYFSLRLYQQEPGLLILFVSFQYGYFWQSALKGASAVLK